MTFYTTYDVTWVGQKIYFWTLFEIFLGIICASVPSLKIYFIHYFPDRAKGYSGYSGYSSSSARHAASSQNHKQRGFPSMSADDTLTDIEMQKPSRKFKSQQLRSMDSRDTIAVEPLRDSETHWGRKSSDDNIHAVDDAEESNVATVQMVN
jgi:hypothetical protein